MLTVQKKREFIKQFFYEHLTPATIAAHLDKQSHAVNLKISNAAPANLRELGSKLANTWSIETPLQHLTNDETPESIREQPEHTIEIQSKNLHRGVHMTTPITTQNVSKCYNPHVTSTEGTVIPALITTLISLTQQDMDIMVTDKEGEKQPFKRQRGSNHTLAMSCQAGKCNSNAHYATMGTFQGPVGNEISISVFGMMECLVESDIIPACDKVTGDEVYLHYRQRGVSGGTTHKTTLGVLNYCPHPTRSEDHRQQTIQQLQKATAGRIGNGEAIHTVADKFIFHFRSEDKGGYAAVYPLIEAPPYNILTIENVTSLTDELITLEQSPLLHNQILMIGLSFTLPTVTPDSTTIPTPTTSVFIHQPHQSRGNSGFSSFNCQQGLFPGGGHQ
jgi:hypothetical protein